MLKAIKAHEAGGKVAYICREFGISAPTFYSWRSKYGGMELSELVRMRELEQENARLKRMYAELSIDHTILKDVISKKGWGVSQILGRKDLMEDIKSSHQTSTSRACRVAGMPRSMAYYASTRDDSAVVEALQKHVDKHPTHGFELTMSYLRKARMGWNHKRVYRVYKLLKLNLKRRGKRRLPARVQQPLAVPLQANVCWSMDFVQDSLCSGRKFRVFNVIDDATRQVVAMEIDTSLPAQRVVRALMLAIETSGKPTYIRCDNGPEFISKQLAEYCQSQRISLQHIQPGKPTQNAFIERFNGTYRREILDAYVFENLQQVRQLSQQWQQEYNCQRPHQSLGGKQTPKPKKELINP